MVGPLRPQQLKQLLQGPHRLLGRVAWTTSCTPTAAAGGAAAGGAAAAAARGHAAPIAAAATAAAVLAPFQAPECRIGQVTLQANSPTVQHT